MNGHLARLALRATGPRSGGLRPRVPALFEQPARLPPVGPTVAMRPVEAVGGTPSAVVPPSGGAAVAGEPPVPLARSSAGRGQRLREVPSEAQEHTDDEDEREVQPSSDRPAPERAALPARDAVRPAPAASGAEPPPGRPSTPWPRSLSPRTTAPEQVVASLVVEALSAGLPPPPAGKVRHGSADDEQARSRDAAPTRGPSGTAPLPTAPLPRLQPPTLPPARAGRTPAAPEVTVHIGRIEVVPPPPEPPAPRRPRQPPRASAAPPLADYLRDRSRR